jgi:plasmid maintenance system antidote protein VapI
MENIKEKIQKAIEENLPKQMGDVLQKRFSELEEIETKYKDLSDLYANQSKELIKLQKERDQLTIDLAERIELLKDIKKREDAVQSKEWKLELEITKIKLYEADKRATELQGIVQTVFKSPIYRKSYSISGTTEYSGTDPHTGNSIYTPNDIRK